MITPQQRDELVAFDAGDDYVLSVYLDMTPNRQVQRMYQAAFQDLARRCEDELNHEQAKAFRVEAERVNAFLDGQPHQGLGVAIYSCTPRDFWRVYFTPVKLDDDIFYGRQPSLRPLVDVLGDYARFGVALVDSKSARLLTVNLGAIEHDGEVLDDVTGRHDQGGWSQARYQRHVNEEIDDHLRNVAHELSIIFNRHAFARLILAGPQEPLARFQELLPDQLKERVIGALSIELTAEDGEVLQQAMRLNEQAERRQEAQLVDALLENAGAGGAGAQGLAPTLDALWNGQVDTLLVVDDLHVPGVECPACGRIVASGRPECPSCGAKMIRLDDVVERAVGRTLEQSGKVDVIHGDPADRLRQESDGVGAILRYTITPADQQPPPDHTTGSGP